MVTLASEDFASLTGPFRDELLAHCYRMLGSVQDAEDQLQETLIRAWRSYGEFQGRASLRTWLYRIATNACLRALENRARRPLPSGIGTPGEDPGQPPAMARPQVPWLQPMPGALLTAAPADPASIVATREGMRLALIAALQYLPPRQRAVLILRDVLGWRAAEVAPLIGASTAAVNSSLQRARARLRAVAPAEDQLREPADPADRELLDRYAAAFQTADVAGLMRLLRRDAVLEMPPLPTWFSGREAVVTFLRTQVLREPGQFAMLPVEANTQPAFAVYLRDDDGAYRAHGIQVLTVAGPSVTRIVSFLDAGLLTSFGLPAELPASRLARA